MKLLNLFLSLIALLPFCANGVDQGAKLNSQEISFELILETSLNDTWNFWTQSKKLEQWLTSEAHVDPQLGGRYELLWDPMNKSENSTLGCRITKFEILREISFDWRGPVPFADLMNVEPFPTQVTVSFESIGENQTRVRFRHRGWGSGEKWAQARDWQTQAWLGAFEELKLLVQKNHR